MIIVISKLLIFFYLSLAHTQIYKFRFQVMGTFSSLPHPLFNIFFPIKPEQRGSLSNSAKHKVPQSILYIDC